MPRRTVALGIDGYRAEPHVTARADDAHRDLPAIRNENFSQSDEMLALGVKRVIAGGSGDRGDADSAGFAERQRRFGCSPGLRMLG
jgi:hypothetical protein